MHILVVDDEELARIRLIRLLSDIAECEVIGEAKNGDEAIAKVRELDPDLVFLDVRMPGDNGIKVAETLSEFNDPPAIVFCTAYDEYALQAFQTLAQGYLLKPVERQQLVEVLEKTRRVTRTQKPQLDNRHTPPTLRQHLSAKTHKGIELIPFATIHCFVADNKYVTVFHDGGESLIDETLKELESEFPGLLIRIHRNALVALKRIRGIEKHSSGQYQVLLSDARYNPIISRRHLSDVRDLIKQR